MINFIELNHTHNRNNFEFGIEELNYFLRNLATQNLKKGLSRTFVAVELFLPFATLQKMYEIAISESVHNTKITSG